MNGRDDSPVDGSLRGRVLIVEDEPLVAENLRILLVECGFDVVGMSTKVDVALRLIEDVGCDVAIVDANLAGVSAAPIAEALSQRQLPFIVLSGYTRAQLADQFLGATYVQKPYRIEQLVEQLNTVLLRRAPATD
jgi:DNA-binding response OmpR family regulator